jgi:hypothetical protein
VPAPAVAAYRYGLYSAAAVVDPADTREFWAGVEFEPLCARVPASTTAGDATAGHGGKTLPEGVDVAQATPLRLVTGVSANLPGRDDLLERARQQLAVSEQQSLERYAWSGAAGNRPRLADPATPVLAGSDTAAVTLPHAVGVLEEFLADRVGGLGVIWAPRWTAGYWSQLSVNRVDGPRVVAPLGDPIVFASVPGVGPGPDGTQAGGGEAWLYATGPVMVRRSPISMPPDLASALDRRTNEVFALAERHYTVGWGCAVAAVRVALPDGSSAPQ